MICCVLLLGLGARARAGLLGDLNGDGRVDGADLKLFVQQLRLSKGGHAWDPNADLDGDSALNRADAALMFGGYLTNPGTTSAAGRIEFPAGFPLGSAVV